jgi:hypothetical protein
MRFGSLQITYHDAMAVLTTPPFLLLVCLRLTLPVSPPPHSSNTHSVYHSRCVCASGDLSGVLVPVCCSFSCFGRGREECSRVLVFISTCASYLATLSVHKVTQSLWRGRTVSKESGSSGRFSLRSPYC